ncbi:MAG: glycosyltransferase N-terminal domain-containing protein [Flavobacteriales bacterium]
MGLFHYQIAIELLSIYLKASAFFGNSKSKKSIKGQKNWQKNLSNLNSDKKTFWIHAASHGEAIMANSIIKKILNQKNNQVVMSFFSPSGYENYNFENENFHKFYLPFDKKRNSKKIIDFINPSILIFVKYDLWLNLIRECNKRKIPTLVFSSKFRDNQWYFNNLGKSAKKILQSMSLILTADNSSKEILEENGFSNFKYSGDTRFDNFNDVEPKLILDIRSPCVILGSSWEKEEKMAAEIIEEMDNVNWIITPHEIKENKILKTKKLFGNEALLYSEIDSNKPLPKILIVDQIGILADLYNYSDIAFVGGGYSGKLHNILEAAAKGNFLLFGPNIGKYPEANLMLKEEIAETIHDSKELKNIILKLLGNKSELEKKKKRARQIIKDNKGATKIIWNEIQKLV